MTLGYFKAYSRRQREIGRGSHSHQEQVAVVRILPSCAQRLRGPSAEDDGTHAIQEGAMFGEEAHRLVEGRRLGVLSDGRQLGDGLGMIDALDPLLDDGPLVEVDGNEMGRGADEFDPAGMGLAVGAGPLEAGQERVVDVDASARQLLAELGREDLHVAGQDHQLDVEIVDGAQYLLLEGRLGLLVDLLPPERHPVELRQVREIRMVGHHLHDVYG